MASQMEEPVRLDNSDPSNMGWMMVAMTAIVGVIKKFLFFLLFLIKVGVNTDGTRVCLGCHDGGHYQEFLQFHLKVGRKAGVASVMVLGRG